MGEQPTRHTLQRQGHVVVTEGSIAAVMIHKLRGTSQAELLVQTSAAPIDLGVPALLADQNHRAPRPLADWPLAVRVLTSAVHQLGGLHQVSWGDTRDSGAPPAPSDLTGKPLKPWPFNPMP